MPSNILPVTSQAHPQRMAKYTIDKTEHQYFGILVSTGFSTWATQKFPETSSKGRKPGNPATYVPFRGNLLTDRDYKIVRKL